MTIWTPPSMPAGGRVLAEGDAAQNTQIALLTDEECVLISDHAGVTNSTTLTNTNLSRPVAASTRYIARGVFFYTAGTGEDFKPGASTPSGTTIIRATLLSLPSSVNVDTGDAYFGTATSIGTFSAPGQTTSSNVIVCYYFVEFLTSSTAGNAVAQYAQASAGAGTATVMKSGSSWWVRKVEGV